MEPRKCFQHTKKKKWNQEHYLSHCIEMNSKQIKDPNVRPTTWKLPQEKREKTLLKKIGKYFLKRTPIAWAKTLEIDEWDYMIFKNLHSKGDNCQREETTNKRKKNPCQLHINLGINIQIYKELKKLNTQTPNPINK